MDINQISQLIKQSGSTGTSSTINNKTYKDQAFTLVLEQMIKSMESQSSDSSSDGSSGSSSSSDTFMGSSNYTSQMLEVMLEAIKQNMDKSSNNTNKAIGTNTSVNNSEVTAKNVNTGNIDGQISSAIDAASAKYNVEKPLIEAVIQQESAFNPSAASGAGAQGLMQLMPATARSLGVTNSFNVNQNIDGGTKYLKSLLDNFNGNTSLALSAYNGGIGTMQSRNVNSTADISKMSNETSNYVKKVIGYYEKYKV